MYIIKYIGEGGAAWVGVWMCVGRGAVRGPDFEEAKRGEGPQNVGPGISSIGECVLVGDIGTAPRNVPHRSAIRYGKAEKVGAKGEDDFPVQKRLGCFC